MLPHAALGHRNLIMVTGFGGTGGGADVLAGVGAGAGTGAGSGTDGGDPTCTLALQWGH